MVRFRKANVLIDEFGSPRLADFGLSWMFVDATLWGTSRKDGTGTSRYMAPELLTAGPDDEENFLSTEKSDVYAYGITSWVSIRCLQQLKCSTRMNRKLLAGKFRTVAGSEMHKSQ